MSPDHFSRRVFLKSTGALLGGLALPDHLRFLGDPPPPDLDPHQRLLWERFDMQITATGVTVKFSDAGKDAIDNWHDPWLPNTGDIVNALALYFDRVYHRRIDANLCNYSLIQTFSVPQMSGGEPLLVPVALPSGETVFRLNQPQASKSVQIDIPKECLYSLVDSQPQLSTPIPTTVATQSGDTPLAGSIQEQPDPSVSTPPITLKNLADLPKDFQFFAPLAVCLGVPVALIAVVFRGLRSSRESASTRIKALASISSRSEPTDGYCPDVSQTSSPPLSPLGSRADLSTQEVAQLAAEAISMEVSGLLRGRATGVKTTATVIGGEVAYFDVTGLDNERVNKLFVSGKLEDMERNLEQRLGVSEVHIVAKPDEGGITVIAGNDHSTVSDMLRIPSNVFSPLDAHGRLFVNGGRIAQDLKSGEFTVHPSQSDAEQIKEAVEWLRVHDHEAWKAYVRGDRDPQVFYRFTEQVVGSDAGIPVPRIDSAHTHYHIVTPEELKQEAGGADYADAAEPEIGDEEVAGRHADYRLVPQPSRPSLPPAYVEGKNVIHSKAEVQTRLPSSASRKK